MDNGNNLLQFMVENLWKFKLSPHRVVLCSSKDVEYVKRIREVYKTDQEGVISVLGIKYRILTSFENDNPVMVARAISNAAIRDKEKSWRAGLLARGIKLESVDYGPRKIGQSVADKEPEEK